MSSVFESAKALKLDDVINKVVTNIEQYFFSLIKITPILNIYLLFVYVNILVKEFFLLIKL